MKKWILIGTLLFYVPSARGEMIERYSLLTKTCAFPYYYAGLGPLKENAQRDHFAITVDARRYTTQIAHYNSQGELSNSEYGWAVFKIAYDTDGRLVEAVFYNMKGKITLNKDLNFAKEKRFYPSKGVVDSRFFGQNGDLLKVETWRGSRYCGPDRTLIESTDPSKGES